MNKLQAGTYRITASQPGQCTAVKLPSFFISGVRNVGTDCERVDDERAEYYTVYQRNADNTTVAICDRPSREQAEYAAGQIQQIVADAEARGVEKFVNRLQQFVDEGGFVGAEVAVIAGAIYCGRDMVEQLRSGKGAV